METIWSYRHGHFIQMEAKASGLKGLALISTVSQGRAALRTQALPERVALHSASRTESEDFVAHPARLFLFLFNLLALPYHLSAADAQGLTSPSE